MVQFFLRKKERNDKNVPGGWIEENCVLSDSEAWPLTSAVTVVVATTAQLGLRSFGLETGEDQLSSGPEGGCCLPSPQTMSIILSRQ